MKLNSFKIIVTTLFISLLFIQCADDDDNGNVIDVPSCNDGVQNGEEQEIDCGGSVCAPCASGIDFSGTFVQEDIMGRPGISTVFGATASFKDLYNLRTITDRNQNPDFQTIFENQLQVYYNQYTEALGTTIAYQENILGLDALEFTSLLAYLDALQVAPNGPTTYFDGTNALTGRSLNDDVIDISLTLIFGGMTGTRFDGNSGTPQLISDGVDSGDRDFGMEFPYLELPL